MAALLVANPGLASPGALRPGYPGTPGIAPPVPPVISLTALPLIPVPVAGFGYQQSDMAQLWASAAAFFQQRVVFRATQVTAATTLPSAGTLVSIVYDNIIEDPYGGWNGVNLWFAPVSGWYQVTVTVWVAAPGAAETVLQVYVQTGKSPGNAAQGSALTAVVLPNAVSGSEGTWVVYLAAGDGVAGAAAIKNSASNVPTNLTAGTSSSLEVIWITG